MAMAHDMAVRKQIDGIHHGKQKSKNEHLRAHKRKIHFTALFSFNLFFACKTAFLYRSSANKLHR